VGIRLDTKMREPKYVKNTTKHTYGIYQWQHKGFPFSNALDLVGWKQSSRPSVFLLDHDLNKGKVGTSRNIIRRKYEDGAMCVLYPHSVLPEWWYGVDFLPDPKIQFRFEIASAQVDAVKMILPKLPTEICGWPFSEIKPFRACSNPTKVLFASIHPPKYAPLRPEAARANSEILSSLKKLRNNYNIRIRYLRKLEAQGLEQVPGIEYKQGLPDGSTKDIEWADVVIAEQTFLWLSAALGKPTIGILQTVCPRGNNLKSKRTDDWEKWWHLVRHPLSHNEGNMKNLIEQASKYEPKEWKRWNIGKKMEPENISNTIERYLRKYKGAIRG